VGGGKTGGGKLFPSPIQQEYFSLPNYKTAELPSHKKICLFWSDCSDFVVPILLIHCSQRPKNAEEEARR
jgi:hypothetical protein